MYKYIKELQKVKKMSGRWGIAQDADAKDEELKYKVLQNILQKVLQIILQNEIKGTTEINSNKISYKISYKIKNNARLQYFEEKILQKILQTGKIRTTNRVMTRVRAYFDFFGA